MLINNRFGASTMLLPFMFPKRFTWTARASQCWPALLHWSDKIWYLYQTKSNKPVMSQNFPFFGIFKPFITKLWAKLIYNLNTNVDLIPYFWPENRNVWSYYRWSIEWFSLVTVRWISAIFVIRPKTMNSKISSWFACSWVTTLLLCVTVWSWPLFK